MMEKAFVIIRQKLTLRMRTYIHVALFACLLLPLLFLASFGAKRGAQEIFLIAAAYACLGAAGIWFFLRLWEKQIQKSAAQLAQAKAEKIKESPSEDKIEIQQLRDEVFQLNQGMDQKREEMRAAYLEFEDLRKEHRNLEEEVARQNEDFKKEIEQKESLLNEYQKTIAEQRTILGKRQLQISKLEAKVRDLMQEIRGLLQLDMKSSGLDVSEQAMLDAFLSVSPSLTPYDLSVQLHRSIEKTEGIMGVDHLGYVGGKSPRFLDLSLESYTVDKRRLFECFKDETVGIIFIYSPAEKKFLFVNQLTKTLLGLSSEKFIKDFPHLVVQGYHEWETALIKAKSQKECFSRLAILDKAGQTKAFECHMGKISKGPFIHHILGILALSNK